MTKARRELAALMPSQDVVIEVLDARLPAASTNPIFGELRRSRACIKVLTKSDLADPEVTKAWIERLERDSKVAVFASTTQRPQETRKRIEELCKAYVGARSRFKPIRALVGGVPNVGKSTLINTLMDRQVARVSDKPAVTTAQQTVTLKSGIVLTDSPGLMWPKIEDEVSALRLALAGSIPDSAFDYLNVAMFAAAFFLEWYPALVVARYKLESAPTSAEALLEEIGRRRGGLRAGGTVDLHKAADILIHEFRSGTLGRISLESPLR